MRNSMACRRGIAICASLLAGTVGAVPRVQAFGYTYQEQPCNDLCREWLAQPAPEEWRVQSAMGVGRDARRPTLRHPTIAPEPSPGHRRHGPGLDEARRVRPDTARAVPERPGPQEGPMRSRTGSGDAAVRRTAANVRPRPMAAEAAPHGPPSSSRLSPERIGGLPPRVVGQGGTASSARAVPDAPGPSRGPRGLALADAPGDHAPVAPLPAAPPARVPVPPVSADGGPKASREATTDTGAEFGHTVTGAHPSASTIPERNPAPVPTVVTTLRPPADAGDASPPASRQGGGIRYGSIRPVAFPPEGPLSVKIGQVSAGPLGTDVHVVVVNVLSREMRDVDVRCRVRDARGLQVAEASARIAGVAPSDVAFGRVLFPSGVTVDGDRFACEVETFGAVDGTTP